MRVFLGPVLSGALTLLTGAITPAVPFLGPQSVEGTAPVNEEIPSVAEIVRNAHKSQKEDRKASKGSDNDLYMLKTHGYNKHRFLSASFIKRNNLKVTGNA